MAQRTRDEQEKLYKLLVEKQTREKYNQIDSFMPDTGPLSRDKYPKSLELYKAGKTFRERANFGANRAGKTVSAAIEVAYHLTGLYPDWWEGYRFDKGVTLWAVGVDTVQVKNVIQKLLLGPEVDFGSGMIPKDYIVGKPTSKPGAASGTVEDAYIKHASGGTSKLTFKSYQQSVRSFYGDAIDFIWFDEEPPRLIYDECLMRLVSTKGLLLATFTPLDGYSDVVMQFLPNRTFPTDHVVDVEGVSKWIIRTEWEDVPHLDEKAKSELLASIQPHMREARSKGIPCVGEGKVYPVEEKTFILDNIILQHHWERVYSVNVSHDSVKIIFAAIDKDKDTVIIYDEYVAANLSPAVNATVINKRGTWLPGTFGCDSRTSKQAQLQIYNQYINEELNIYNCDSEVSAGIAATLGRLITGRLKVLSTCENWIHEFRGYAYDEAGNIKGKTKNLAQDALMEATHDLVLKGIDIACTKPEDNRRDRLFKPPGKNSITGY